MHVPKEISVPLFQEYKNKEILSLFSKYYSCGETAFRPTIETISVKIKNILQNSAGSLKKKIPISAVPTAPIPVHTAYAVPSGSD